MAVPHYLSFFANKSNAINHTSVDGGISDWGKGSIKPWKLPLYLELGIYFEMLDPVRLHVLNAGLPDYQTERPVQVFEYFLED